MGGVALRQFRDPTALRRAGLITHPARCKPVLRTFGFSGNGRASDSHLGGPARLEHQPGFRLIHQTSGGSPCRADVQTAAVVSVSAH